MVSKEKEALLDSIKLNLWYKRPDIFFKDITGFTPNRIQTNILRTLTDLSNNRMLICSASGVGKTYTLSNIAFWSATILPRFIKRPYKTLIVSGSLPQAQVLYEYSRDFFKASDLLRKQIKGEPIKSRTEFIDGSSIKAVARSLSSFYGEHPDLLIIDEAVLAGDEIIKDGLSRVAPSPQSRIILSSTPYDLPSTLFVDMWEMKDRYPAWKRFSWKTHECPWIDAKSIEEARKSLSVAEYQIKWEGVPSALLGTIYSKKDLKLCRVQDKPIMGSGPISLGVDWGFEHPTALEVVQDEGEFKYHLEEKVMKGESIDKIHNVIDGLVERFKISTIIADSSHIFENQRLQKRLRPKGIRIILVPFKSEKARMIEQLRALIEHHKIKIWEHQLDLIHELMNYTYDTKRKDDRHDALMLACSIFRDTSSSIQGTVTFRKFKYK